MQSQERGLRGLCRLFGYTPQAYYQYQRHFVKRNLQEELLLQQVRLHRRTQPRLGARKLLILLAPFMAAHQISVGRDVFVELLRSQGLLIRRRRGRPRTTMSVHYFKKYPDLAKGLEVGRPGQLWVSDITYLHLSRGGFAYLSLVTDVYSHKIVGYHLNHDLSAEGCIISLGRALLQRSSKAPLIHHSDRGVQYCSADYVRQLRQHGISISMTQSGDPRENAIAGRVNGILKQELLQEVYPCFSQAEKGVAAAIGIYNNLRPHSSVDMLTPEQAHLQTNEIRRRWKSYYKQKVKKASMDG